MPERRERRVRQRLRASESASSRETKNRALLGRLELQTLDDEGLVRLERAARSPRRPSPCSPCPSRAFCRTTGGSRPGATWWTTRGRPRRPAREASTDATRRTRATGARVSPAGPRRARGNRRGRQRRGRRRRCDRRGLRRQPSSEVGQTERRAGCVCWEHRGKQRENNSSFHNAPRARTA